MSGGGLKTGADITISPAITLSATKNSILYATGSTTLTINGTISGAGNLTIANGATGTVVLGGANDYTGATNIYAKLKIANSTALSTSAINIGSSGVLDVAGYSIANAITITSSGGTIRSSVSGGVITGGVTLAGYYITLSAASAASLEVGTTAISGTGTTALTIGSSADTGSVTLSAANTYVGSTNVLKGTLNIANVAGLGTSDAGTTIASTATLDLQNVAVLTEAITINGGTLATSTGTSSLSGAITLGAINNTFSVAGTQLTLSGVISGGNGFTKTGSGTLTLSNANTYTGTTTISAGTLKAGNAAALGPSTGAGAVSITSGAVLDLNGQSLTNSGALTINGTGITLGGALINSSTTAASYSGLVALGAASSIVGGSGTIALTNVGTITGATFGLTLGGAQGGSIASIIGTTSGTVTKQDSGTWTLSGANTYTGATTVSAGTLAITNATGLGTTIASGATLDLQNVVVLAEAITINGGTLATSTGTSSLSGAITLGATNNTFSVTGTQLTLSGVISGASRGITKEGSGILVLSNTNSYSGPTTINGGVLSGINHQFERS
jgi:autotransporter-associated beta strand protein